MTYDGPVWDNHFHLDPTGLVEEAAKQFQRAGGTHLLVMHKPYGEVRGPRSADKTNLVRFVGAPRFNRTLADHRADFDTTLALAERVRKGVPELTVFVALGPHPAEFTKALEEGVPFDEADAVYRDAVDLAGRYVDEGKAIAIGEIGRPHWQPVEPRVWEAANAQMEHAFRVARDQGCPAIIHCETGTPDVYADLARHCDEAGLARDKAVKHYSPPVVLETMNHGLFPSVLVGKDAAEEALRQGTRFLMETDYMDDPRYPGAVLGPKTVPKRTKDLLSKGIMTEEQAWVVHKENPEKVYGLDLSA